MATLDSNALKPIPSCKVGCQKIQLRREKENLVDNVFYLLYNLNIRLDENQRGYLCR